jgi:hypothetical protein
MTIHFRTRIQSPIDYSANLFPGENGCCCTGSSENSAFVSSYGNCNALGGYFTQQENCSEITCLPTGRTGCCCACAYEGATEGVEYSVCQDLDGVWEEGPCSESPICIKNGRDVTEKRACCGFTYDASNNIISQCFDVCIEKDCFDLRIQPYSSTFYPTGGDCTILGNLCSSPQLVGMNNNREDFLGNCCVQGRPCKCYKNITFDACNFINGSFYYLGDPEPSCEDCLNNCSETV